MCELTTKIITFIIPTKNTPDIEHSKIILPNLFLYLFSSVKKSTNKSEFYVDDQGKYN